MEKADVGKAVKAEKAGKKGCPPIVKFKLLPSGLPCMKEVYEQLKQDFKDGKFPDLTKARNSFPCRAYNKATPLFKYADIKDEQKIESVPHKSLS